ncbi:hypothetical protein [Armatimonas sp.]|uniref:hypothetical protein n=1 Tax=Armatimonas sp. TaxID=1872638 RepID=UPI0037503191
MSIVLELSPAEEAVLSQAATARQMDVVSYIREKVFMPEKDEPPLEETIRFLQEEGQRAISEAQQKLMEQGIGYVTGDETTVKIHLPNKQRK